MPSRHNFWCADCGKRIYRNKNSLPQGRATCQSCRKTRNAWVPPTFILLSPLPTIRDCQSSVTVLWSLAGPALAWGALKACDFCGGPFETVSSARKRTHCASCRQRLGALRKVA